MTQAATHVRTWIVVATAAALAAGCAQDPLSGPSYVGLSDLSVTSSAEANSGNFEANASLRYVNSNKVLGAMAFQKVTGRSVDARRLVGSE